MNPKIVEKEGDWTLEPAASDCTGMELSEGALPLRIRLTYEDGTPLLVALSDDAVKSLYWHLKSIIDPE